MNHSLDNLRNSTFKKKMVYDNLFENDLNKENNEN